MTKFVCDMIEENFENIGTFRPSYSFEFKTNC